MFVMVFLCLILTLLTAASAQAEVFHAVPGDDLQTKVNTMRPGDELRLADGKYKGWLDLNARPGITIRAEQIVPVKMEMKDGQPVGTGGNVMIESAGHPFAVIGNTGITLQGLTFDGCGSSVQSGAIKCKSNWTLEDVIVQNTDGVGITIDGHSENVTWTRVVTQHNGYMGWGGGESKHIRITDSGTFRNNLGWPTNTFGDHGHEKNGKWYVDPQFEAGGGKFAVCDDLVMTRVWAQGNNGPGIWFDYQNKNIVVKDSMSIGNVGLIHSYDAVGIHSEINLGPILIENCLIRDNGIGILPAEEHGLTVRGCSLVNNGVAFRNLGNAKDGFRNEGCRDVTIAGNSFYGSARISFWGENDNMTAEYREAHKIVISPNELDAPLPVKWHVDGLNAPASGVAASPEPSDGGEYVDAMPDILKNASNGYGQAKLNRSNSEGRPDDGTTLTIAGTSYARGIGCHAPFRLTIPLNGDYSALRFFAGIDDETRGSGTVIIRVEGNGKTIYESPVLRWGDKAVDVSASVKGMKSVTLHVTDAKDGNDADHADFGWIRLIQ